MPKDKEEDPLIMFVYDIGPACLQQLAEVLDCFLSPKDCFVCLDFISPAVSGLKGTFRSEESVYLDINQLDTARCPVKVTGTENVEINEKGPCVGASKWFSNIEILLEMIK